MKMLQLGRVKQIIEEATGLDITHFYDDVVFVDNSPFVIIFDRNDTELIHIYYNQECSGSDRMKLNFRMIEASSANKMKCRDAGEFKMSQIEGAEEIRLELIDQA